MRDTNKPTKGRLPDFVVVGAAKAGTTSLDFYLSLHPEIHMAHPKETRFFMEPPRGRWNRGLSWYTGLFDSNKPVCGEATPAYSQWPAIPGVAEKLQAVIPQAKLIYMVRDPLDRLKSHFRMVRRLESCHESLRAHLAASPDSRLLCASRYGTQLAHLRKFFPAEQILVVESSALEAKRAETLAGIFRFLGVDDNFHSVFFAHRRNVSSQQVVPNATGRRILESLPAMLLRRICGGRLFFFLQNLLLLPFASAEPDWHLPPDLAAALADEFRKETALLRRLTGQPLPSLGYGAALPAGSLP
jgi:hypothetical protein